MPTEQPSPRQCSNFTRGATALSYALLIGLISITALAAISQSGGSINALFTDVADSLPGDNLALGGGGGGSASPSASASASASASPLPDMLVPGNTTKTVTRDGYQVQCQSWNGTICEYAVTRFDGRSEYTSNCPTYRNAGEWHYMVDSTNWNVDLIRFWCHIATEDPAYNPYQPVTTRQAPTPGWRFLPDSQSAAEVDMTHCNGQWFSSSADGYGFYTGNQNTGAITTQFQIWEPTNSYVQRIECTAWIP